MSSVFRDQDIAPLFADFGVPVIIGTMRMRGIVDYVPKDQLQTMQIAGVSGTAITVTVQTSKLPSGLRNKAALTVDGDPMILRDSQTEGDGGLTHLLVERTS